jgi:Tol biopolymer transport system component
VSSSDLRPDLAAHLERLVPVEQFTPRWQDVVGRAGAVPRGSRRRVFYAVGAAALLLLFLAGVATAVYRLLHHQTPAGALTITAGGYNAKWPVEIVEVKPDGRSVILWRCPIASGLGCGEPEGIAWSPDGHRVAFTIAALNSRSDYLGLHILNVETRRDVHPVMTNCTAGAVAWSPDGQTLAFDCPLWRRGSSRIHLINPDGTHDRVLAAAGVGANAPTWSPDGSRLAFARHNAIYILRLRTGFLRLVARSGISPDWSPDGRVIAYRSSKGVRLVTPEGVPVRAANGALIVGPAGWPAWSPDGKRLAIAGSGLYIVDADGSHLQRLGVSTTLGAVGPRPAWYPSSLPPRSLQPRRRGTEPGCNPC